MSDSATARAFAQLMAEVGALVEELDCLLCDQLVPAEASRALDRLGRLRGELAQVGAEWERDLDLLQDIAAEYEERLSALEGTG